MPAGNPYVSIGAQSATDPLELGSTTLICVTEYLCTCNEHWTSNPTTICDLCQDRIRTTEEATGHFCDCCGRWLTAEDPLFCSAECEAKGPYKGDPYEEPDTPPRRRKSRPEHRCEWCRERLDDPYETFCTSSCKRKAYRSAAKGDD
jgi:hypothetical protein